MAIAKVKIVNIILIDIKEISENILNKYSLKLQCCSFN